RSVALRNHLAVPYRLHLIILLSALRHSIQASSAAAEEAGCVAQNLRANEWIGIGAHDDRSRLAAGRPTHHVGLGRAAGHCTLPRLAPLLAPPPTAAPRQPPPP